MRAIDADELNKCVLKWLPQDPCGKEEKEMPFETDICVSMLMEIDEQPTIQPEPHWIPVTERLPETSDAVLTTYIVNGDRSRRYVEESSYYGNDESWSSPWDEYRIAGTRIEVIEWMPLPESYRGE